MLELSQPELSLEDMLQAFRKQWKDWLGVIRPGDMLEMVIDSDAFITVVGTREHVTGVVLSIRNTPMNPTTERVETVMDVWINTPRIGTETPRGYVILGYVDVRRLTLLSRYEA